MADARGIGAEGALLACGKQVAAKVAAEEKVSEVDDAGKDEEPGGLEVEVAAPAVLVGHDVAVAGGDGVARGGDVEGEERLRVHVADLAPVEARMGDQDLDAGDEKRDESEEGEPMRDADEQGMAELCVARNLSGGWHAARIARVDTANAKFAVRWNGAGDDY